MISVDPVEDRQREHYQVEDRWRESRAVVLMIGSEAD
jgi:hypothetical protein